MMLKGVEIFATGRWNDIKTFTGDDLDRMVESFAALNLGGRAPLKFGHNNEQPLTDGQPALGWVSRVYREGDKLLADFTDVPRVVHEAIRDGRYKFVSVELLRDVVFGGAEYPWVLSAVALLGADIPAVGALRDLQGLALSRRPGLQVGARLTFTRGNNGNGDPTMNGENKAPDLTALAAQVQDLSGKVANFSAENATLKADNQKLKDDAARREAEIKSEKVATHRGAIKERFNAAINKKLILPSTREMFERDPAFKSDDGVLGITLDFVDSYIKERHIPGAKDSGIGDGGEDNLSGGDKAGEEGLEPDMILCKRVDKALAFDQRFKGVSRSIVTNHVLKEDPELAEKYRMQPGVKGG